MQLLMKKEMAVTKIKEWVIVVRAQDVFEHVDTSTTALLYMKYEKVPETKKLFSLIFTVFAIWKHLEADCFAILHRFDTEKTNQRKQ